MDDQFATELGALIPDLLRYARTITRDEGLSEDLVAATLLRATERRDSFRGASSLQTWLHRILHNLAVDEFRRRRETPMAADDLIERVERNWRDDTYSVDAAVVVERAEQAAELREALIRLPFEARSALLLHDAHGLTNPEIAVIQQASLPAVKQRVRRGRMMLVSALAAGAERRGRLAEVPMHCWDARDRVSDYLDDDLEPPLRQTLEQHLGTCPTCPPLVAALVGATDALRGRDPDSVLDPDVLARLRRRAGHVDGAHGAPPRATGEN